MTSVEEVVPTLARRAMGTTVRMHSTEQMLITAIMVVEVLAFYALEEGRFKQSEIDSG